MFKKGKQQKLDKPKTPKKVTAKQATEDFVFASKEFEKVRINDIEKSKKTAWTIAIVSCVLSIVLGVAIMMLTPLKEVRPYVIRVDNNSGETDIVTMLSNGQNEYGEEVAKYFSALYVQLREGYDWYTIQTNIDRLMMFSNADQQNLINNKFAQPNAPHKVYKDNQRVEIKITNTSLIADKGLMQVRYTKTVLPKNGGTYSALDNRYSPAHKVTNHFATLGYDYVNIPTVDDVRLINPLGFTVVTYRVDDIVGVK